jgi:BMFP domain-containing protein YqiC
MMAVINFIQYSWGFGAVAADLALRQAKCTFCATVSVPARCRQTAQLPVEEGIMRSDLVRLNYPAASKRGASLYDPAGNLTCSGHVGHLESSFRSDEKLMQPQFIDDLAKRLSAVLPGPLAEGATALRQDLENNFRAVLQTGLAKLDLVTRNEFDVQAGVLRRTREKLEALEASLAELQIALTRQKMP